MTIVIPFKEFLFLGIIPLPLLYILIGCVLTIYWGRNIDELNILMDGTIIFRLFFWPLFLILFVVDIIKGVKNNNDKNSNTKAKD